jgi:hypothetical protein
LAGSVNRPALPAFLHDTDHRTGSSGMARPLRAATPPRK